MDAILTVTFHPCIDVNASVPELIPEVKLACSHVRRQPGGGGINVARAIRQLGGKATAIYMAGGSSGKKLNRLLDEEGVPSVVLEVDGETRENIIIREESSGRQYRFNLPGPPVSEAALEDLLLLLDRMDGIRYLVVSGSLAPGMSPDIFRQLAGLTQQKSIRLIVDTSGEALKAAVAQPIYLVKPSVHELLSLTTGDADGKDIGQRARQLICNGGCRAVVVSLGAGGAKLVTRHECRNYSVPRVKVLSTVGAGDSLVAGIVLSLAQGKSLGDAVAFGCLSGTAATLHSGTSLCKAEDVSVLKLITEEHEKDPVN